jgi:hypothetical protein
MPSPVLQIRMPEAEMKLLRDEAEKRGKQPSVLAREILSECLNGPGVATAGRLSAKRAVIQKREKPVLQEASQGPAVLQGGGLLTENVQRSSLRPKKKAVPMSPPLSTSERLRVWRENG